MKNYRFIAEIEIVKFEIVIFMSEKLRFPAEIKIRLKFSCLKN